MNVVIKDASLVRDYSNYYEIRSVTVLTSLTNVFKLTVFVSI
jgi:hypothetical protein